MAAQYLARADAMTDEAHDLRRRGQPGRAALVLSLAAVFAKAARRWSERAAALPFPEGAELVHVAFDRRRS